MSKCTFIHSLCDAFTLDHCIPCWWDVNYT